MSELRNEASRLVNRFQAGEATEVFEILEELDPLRAGALCVQMFERLGIRTGSSAARAFARKLAARAYSTTRSNEVPAPPSDPEARARRAVGPLLRRWKAAISPRAKLDIWHGMNNDLRIAFVSKLARAASNQLDILGLFHPSEVAATDSMASLKKRAESRRPKPGRRPLRKREEGFRTLGQGYLLATPGASRGGGSGWRLKPSRRK
jgi:hypothetical protein